MLTSNVDNIVDVAIIGGGPAGATAGTLLKKYNPSLRVHIFEREVFPRDHVGESQLPPISLILDEMGCWDKVEAANFPIKVGATYKWGKSAELWDFEFIPAEKFNDEPRPAKFEGQRRFTAFQVDRAVYDKILLDHAAESGCIVHQPVKVREVQVEGDRITGLTLNSGETVTARYYIDASGQSGILRRAIGVAATYPSTLQNIAIWDYWQNTDWAVKIGVGGTRVQVISVPYGWIWFIPLGPTRTSVGLIVPAEYYKSSGKTPAELYAEALDADERIKGLMTEAVSENSLSTTKDWSFLADRTVGENWFLIGESAGFADPILAAGLTMAHSAGREAAYTIVALDRQSHDRDWLKEQFDRRQTGRIRNHIRFADFWYTSNAQFKDLKEVTAKLALDSGMAMTPDKAWMWLGQGGFINEDEETGSSGFSLSQLKQIGNFFGTVEPSGILEKTNQFELNFAGATFNKKARYDQGQIEITEAYNRDGRTLPLRAEFAFLVETLKTDKTWPGIIAKIMAAAEPYRPNPDRRTRIIHSILQALEAMITDGWVTASHNSAFPLEDLRVKSDGIRPNRDPQKIGSMS